MKKVFLLLAVCTLVCTATAQDVKIKRGKVTMSEAQYNELKAKADAYDKAQSDLSAVRNQLEQTSKPVEPRTFNDSASYAIGRDANVGDTMRDCEEGKNSWTDQMARPLLQRFQQNFERRQREGVQDNIKAGEKYLEEISNNKSVYTTKSGLKYRKLKDGNGKKPKVTDRVKVHYTGKLINGTTFDSSVERGEPITFALNQVIPGWTEGLQLMDEGSKYLLYIPYNLGYGEQQAGSIPPGSTLIFEVELLEINPK